MRIKMLKIDEREHWCDEIKEKTKAIYTCLLFSPEKRVHCCEITPSYELKFVEYQAILIDELEDQGREDEREEIFDAIDSGESGEPLVQYFHCRTVDGAEEIKMGAIPQSGIGVIDLGYWGIDADGNAIDDSEEDQMEAALEYCQGNQV